MSIHVSFETLSSPGFLTLEPFRLFRLTLAEGEIMYICQKSPRVIHTPHFFACLDAEGRLFKANSTR